MSNDDLVSGLDEKQLSEIVQHLQSDEEISAQSKLDSLESFEDWISSHPCLRQMIVVDKLADIGPALLGFLRAMLGFDQPEPKTSNVDTGAKA